MPPAASKAVQRLNDDCIELLRHLHDHPSTRFALLPEQLRHDKPGTSTWDHAVAWLGAARPTDVFLDRAHTIDGR